MDYKKEEIKEYFDEYFEQNEDWLKESKYWKEDLHHHAFNEDYYIIGRWVTKNIERIWHMDPLIP